MALRWDFKEDLLGWIESQDIKEQRESNRSNHVRVYDGNALMIACWENDESNQYWLYGFFADEEHAKNCVSDGMYKQHVFHLYRKKKSNRLAKCLTKLQITVVWEDEECTTKEE